MTSVAEKRARFRALHQSGCFVLPNPWDVGSALRLERRGFAALATNSSNAIGISLAFGGGKYFGSPAVGMLGDGVLYTPCLSNANAGRYGDYSTVRAAFPNSSLYSAVGYCFIGKFDSHYLLFGRSADVNPEPIH